MGAVQGGRQTSLTMVNHKRVERIWRREGLKVPQRQPKRGRLWLNDGSCIRLRPEYPGHVWAYDFVEGRTHDGRKFRILTIIDEASRECLALIVARKLKHEDVLAAFANLFISRGPLAHIGSDNGSEFIATAVQRWLGQIGVKTLYIAPGSPWENGYNEKLGFARPAAQWVASRRTAQQQDILQPRRDQGADRSLTAALQHRSPSCHQLRLIGRGMLVSVCQEQRNRCLHHPEPQPSHGGTARCNVATVQRRRCRTGLRRSRAA